MIELLAKANTAPLIDRRAAFKKVATFMGTMDCAIGLMLAVIAVELVTGLTGAIADFVVAPPIAMFVFLPMFRRRGIHARIEGSHGLDAVIFAYAIAGLYAYAMHAFRIGEISAAGYAFRLSQFLLVPAVLDLMAWAIKSDDAQIGE